ncbi:hypothetical protein [Lentzea cavernae]|uniref:Secreted protein n=1 Tax=Lentzea cavernae TaxID=2020703 RepID=A0ABQ3MCC8_9PSEU|nr:hypothetical protein [Lentzea cavernae]GHH39437.1 hypothetical protein GCM10017774_31070 [Lentzea cavernae]
MFARFKHLLISAVAATIAIVIAAPAASAAEPPDKSALNTGSSYSATDVRTNAWPITPPGAFPPGTPCYREEVVEPIYETGQGQLMYEFYFGANVCIFSDRIVVYDPESEVIYPGGQQDVRLASVTYSIRNTIVPVDNPSTPNDVYTYSALNVIFCPDLPRPSACQQYHHQLGLEFTRGWVYPIGRFDRIS